MKNGRIWAHLTPSLGMVWALFGWGRAVFWQKFGGFGRIVRKFGVKKGEFCLRRRKRFSENLHFRAASYGARPDTPKRGFGGLPAQTCIKGGAFGLGVVHRLGAHIHQHLVHQLLLSARQ